MSVLTVLQAKSSNDFKAATSFKSATFAAIGNGNSLAHVITALAAELPFVTPPETFNGTTAFPMTLLATNTTVAGKTSFLYTRDNITDAPTSIRYKVNAASGSTQQASDAWEIGNTGGATLTLRVDQKVARATNTAYSETFTTLSPNEVALVYAQYSATGTTTVSAPSLADGWLLTTHGNGSMDSLYDADTDVAGSKTVSWSLSASRSSNIWIVTLGNNSATPTVTSVVGSAVTEGGVKRYTVTLSGPTSSPANYTAAFSGTASSADYDTNLSDTGGHATYSGGVTFATGSMTVPTAVTVFTVDVNTTLDVLDEAAETIILTVGGVASTGDNTIADDDPAPAINKPSSVTVDGGDSVVLTYTIPVVSGQVTQARLVLTDGTKVGGVDYTNVITNAMLSDGVTISAGVLSFPALLASFRITIPTTA